ncbi:MAG TPA: zf-TFIIB domain-containing protein [Verrucomicrobiae bacterium]|nr:zf-TFIIB domain-containing protein [Verrucomicrobiae bacterium]
MIFQGAKFCSHCGARVERAEIEEAKSEPCPRCGVGMTATVLGSTTVRECPKCAGLWVDTATLERICAERERQAAVLGLASPAIGSGGALEDRIQYLPCPVCRKLMNRVNFAHYSNVVVDVCKEHGTWFDRDELRRVIEFIRGGGLDEARTRELSDLKERERRLSAAQTAAAWSSNCADEESSLNRHQGISLLAGGLIDLFR